MLSPEQDNSDPSACLLPEDTLAEQSLDQARQEWRHHWQERRSHQRYPLGTPFSCKLELDSGRFPPMPVQLVDISHGGACLLISSLVDLRRGEKGELHRPASGEHSHHPLDGRRLWICWQETRDWIMAVGVAFETPLESVSLSESTNSLFDDRAEAGRS